jgi:hypothetical protein
VFHGRTGYNYFTARKITNGIVNFTRNWLFQIRNKFFIDYNSWRIEQLTDGKPKVYIYDLPRKYKPTNELPLLSQTYFALYDFFRLYFRTSDPQNADYF